MVFIRLNWSKLATEVPNTEGKAASLILLNANLCLYLTTYMRSNLKLATIIATGILLVSASSYAQRGGRLGIIMGAAKTSINNADDKSAPADKLLPIGTAGFQRGVEVGYMWRFFGLSAQVMGSQFGQKYKLGNYNATTRLNYIRPTILLNGTTSTKKDFRLTAQIGGYLGMLTSYKDVVQGANAVTGEPEQTLIENLNYTVTGPNELDATVSKPIYYNSDAGLVFALGMEFRFTSRVIFGLQGRIDMGMETIENYDKMKLKYNLNETAYSVDYEHWRNTPYKYRTDLLYTGVRKPSTNAATGAYLTLRYVLQSRTVMEYEMDGY
jgi:hypothetical protein